MNPSPTRPSADLVFSPTDFVAILNQTLEFAYPSVVVQGELANFRVSKNRWVYFDLKDEYSSVKFFGTVYQLPGPLEDGLVIQVQGTPKLHPQYGFSINVQAVRAVGEGSIKRAAALLEAKLAAEGLFNPARKRLLPYPPKTIGLIASSESAAYADFIKIMNERWSGVEIELADVHVQGDLAPSQIVAAIEYFNSHAIPVDALVITRGGGSPEDLAAFNIEMVIRAVAASRIPTLVAIGHEVDLSLAELAADQRASTPSNAAQLLVPDKRQTIEHLKYMKSIIGQNLDKLLQTRREQVQVQRKDLMLTMRQVFTDLAQDLKLKRLILEALNPATALRRGYAIIRQAGNIVSSGTRLNRGDKITLQIADAEIGAQITDINLQ